MDWPFYLYGLLAIAIALSLSSVELLTRYHSRGVREIFFSVYYLFFAFLNAVFCFLAYWALPHLSQVVIKTEFASSVDQGLVRALVAGFSYLVIARMSILDIRTGEDGTTSGVGFDAIYNGFAQYLLNQHRLQMRRAMRDDFEAVFQRASANEPDIFTKAASLVMAGLDTAKEQTDFKDHLDRAKTNFANDPPSYCYTIYLLIRDYTTGPQEVAEQIQKSRGNP
jgi:hypothetical protein